MLRKVKRHAENAWHAVDIRLIRLFALNRFTASLYYTFFSRSFAREHLSVLRGRLAYKKSLQVISSSSALLRRNTHRLEKGLIMQPRRPVFARNFIQETVECYLRCLQSNSIEQHELKWAHDVLSEYFSVVAADPVVDRARRLFTSAPSSNEATDYKPYPHKVLPESPVHYAELLTLFQRRRSVRWYQDRAIPAELIEQAVSAASLAPSACNRQPYRLAYFEKPDHIKQISGFAMGTSGFNEQLPGLFVVIGDLSCYPKERDRHVIYIDASLAAMQLMLALETVGLSSCPINWPDIESRERKMARRLGLETHERVIMLIATGYALADGGVPFSQKKHVGGLLSINQLTVQS